MTATDRRTDGQTHISRENTMNRNKETIVGTIAVAAAAAAALIYKSSQQPTMNGSKCPN